MGKFVYLFFLLLVLKSVVSEDVKSELISEASNSTNQTQDEIKTLDSKDWFNPNFGFNDKIDGLGTVRMPVSKKIRDSYLDHPGVYALVLAYDTLSPAEYKTFRRICAKLGMNRFRLRYVIEERRKSSHPDDSKNHSIRKRDMRKIEKDILHSTGLFNRKQKRSIIPDAMFYYFNRFLFAKSQNGMTAEPTTSEITTDKSTDPKPEPTSSESTNFGQIAFESSSHVSSTIEPSTPEPITLKSLQDRLEKILRPQLNDYPTVEDQINNLVNIEDEQLKNNIRNAIKTDESDERTIMYNIDIPEMKSDAIYVQRLSGSAADNMAAFLKEFEANGSENFDFKLLEPEIMKGKEEKEEKHDNEDFYPEEEDREEEEEDDA